MNIQYALAKLTDLEELLQLVASYHKFESIDSFAKEPSSSLMPLIGENSDLGFVLTAKYQSKLVGYLAMCYGYTIEFGGRDAFVDECYVVENMRDKGIGSELLSRAKNEAKANSVRVIHLEVAVSNNPAKRLYQQNGFSSREKFHLMSCTL